MTADVFDTLSKIESFSDLKPEEVSIERLGGLTNRNYKLDTPKGLFVLRLAGEGTSDYIDRSAEFHNASIAARAGVNAEIVYFNVDDGTMICRYIENAVTMDQEKFRDLEAIRRTGRAFRQLHDCGEKFKGDFELFQQIDQYIRVVKGLGAALPDGYEAVQQDAEKVRTAISLHQLPSGPCHCDPMVENCIDNGEQIFVIDFEYAGNNDPMWDLGDLSVEGAFSDEQDNVFLTAYFGHEPSNFDVGRMVMYKAMCDLLWTLWGVVQHANDNSADDFWAYAVERLERCKTLMATEEFPKHLLAVNHGP